MPLPGSLDTSRSRSLTAQPTQSFLLVLPFSSRLSTHLYEYRHHLITRCLQAGQRDRLELPLMLAHDLNDTPALRLCHTKQR